MKKRLLLFVSCFVLTFISYVTAQKYYYVQSLYGNVTLKQGRTVTPLQVGDTLTVDSKITIPSGGIISLLTPSNRRLYTFNHAGTNTVKALIETNKVSVKTLAKTYFAYIWKRMTNGQSSQYDTSMSQFGSTSRGCDTLSTDSLYEPTASP